MAFMVTASCRGQGIGAKLIESAKQWSNAQNLDYIQETSAFVKLSQETAQRYDEDIVPYKYR
ncbi:MAG: GNAT family N-acetyltransferase [Oscillospiraceae bacterium]|nr:GNAT family N-acetyltransferase [Oscillospiraceae bacterium]